MDTWQASHISTNLTMLLNYTECSHLFLSILVQKKVLGESDIADLDARQHRHDKVARLYDILKGRINAYEILKEALFETRQTGAYKILSAINSRNATTSFKNCGQICYNKKELIGRGAGTKVYNGKFCNRNVAVKVMDLDDADAENALKEVDFMLKLDKHENIVRFYHAEITEDALLIAIEKCDATLQDLVEKGSEQFGIRTYDKLDIVKQIAQGIAYLHKNNIMHGDLKPTNLLVLILHEQQIRVKISDFGFSRKINDDRSSLTMNSCTGLGTQGWIAPELIQTSNPRKSLASDIFSLGCIYYFVLSNGEHPFGDVVRRQTNIVDNKPNFNFDILQVEDCRRVGVTQLISKMISHVPSKRPTIEKVLTYQTLNCTAHFEENVSVSNENVESIGTALQNNIIPEISEASTLTPQVSTLCDVAVETAVAPFPTESVPLHTHAPAPPVPAPPQPQPKPNVDFGRKVERETKRIGKQIGRLFK